MTSVASLDGRKTKTVALRTTMNPIWCVCDIRLRLRSRLCDGRLQDLDGSLGRSSLTSFERNELSDQVFELAWQRIRYGRRIMRVQLTTDCG